jgi:hypothetical protein
MHVTHLHQHALERYFTQVRYEMGALLLASMRTVMFHDGCLA